MAAKNPVGNAVKTPARLAGVRKENLLANKDGRLNCGKEGTLSVAQPLGTQQQSNTSQPAGQKRQRKSGLANDKHGPAKCVEDEGKQSNLELLRKIFPNLSTPELAASLSSSNGELVKAIQHLVLKKQSIAGKPDDHQQVAFKQQNAFTDQDPIAGSKRKANGAQFGNCLSSTAKLNDGLLLAENNVLSNLKTNLQTNLQHMQGNLSASVGQKATSHSPLFNSPCQSPLSANQLQSQLFKEAFRASSGLFLANPAKTTDTLCSPATATGACIQPAPNSSALNSISNSISNSIQVNHLLAQHSPGNSLAGNSASYLSMLASMSNQVENNCFNNQNLFDPILHPLNDAMMAMASQQQQQLNKRAGHGRYNGSDSGPMPPANNKNGSIAHSSLTCNLNNQLSSAFQRSILNETNNQNGGGFPYPLYPFLFSTATAAGEQTDSSLKSSLVAAIAQQKAVHLQQQAAGLNGAAVQSAQFPPNEAMLIGTFGHLLADPDAGDLKAAKDTSLTSGSSQCSSQETSSRSPIKYGA